MSNMYNIGLSGVMANQVAMNVTAQNTANMNTDGYTRKVVQQSSVVYGNGQQGGVTVNSIRRVSDQAAVDRLRVANQDAQYALAYTNGMTNIENLFGMDGLNFNTGLNDFFAAIDEASISPESIVYRDQILSEADELAQRLNSTANQLETQLSQLVSQQSNTIDTVNAQLNNIADLNEQLRNATAQGQDTSGLQDAMDTQLNELSKNIGVKTLYQEDGTVEVTTLSGQPLVVGTQTAQIARDSSNSGAYNTDLVIQFQDTEVALKMPSGGELGAIDELKNEQYLPIAEDLDEIAVAFADAVNAVLAGGTDLNGNSPGKPLFVYDPEFPAATLSLNPDLTAEELALSSNGEAGNGDILAELSQLANDPITVGDQEINIYDAYSKLLGTIGIESSSAIQSYETATISLNEAQSARDSISAVSSDEEAANLMMYMNAYSANMKIISTANDMFDTVLNSF